MRRLGQPEFNDAPNLRIKRRTHIQPQSSSSTALSPFTITSSSLKFDTRARGRYANLKIENTAAGESWRFGTFQVDIQPDGRRG